MELSAIAYDLHHRMDFKLKELTLCSTHMANTSEHVQRRNLSINIYWKNNQMGGLFSSSIFLMFWTFKQTTWFEEVI